MFAIMFRRTIVSDVVQGIIIGGVLAFITSQIIMNAYVSRRSTAGPPFSDAASLAMACCSKPRAPTNFLP
jgi:hypothetical protein